MQNWWFCGKNFCDFLREFDGVFEQCKAEFGPGAILFLVAFISVILLVCLAVVSLLRVNSAAAKATPTPPTNQPTETVAATHAAPSVPHPISTYSHQSVTPDPFSGADGSSRIPYGPPGVTYPNDHGNSGKTYAV